jgi:putative oxidoreductase
MNLLTRLQSTERRYSLILLRAVLGWLLVAEGSGKLWGWFGGAGLETTRMFYDQLRVPFSPYHAAIVGWIEFAGGILLMAGLFVRLAVLPVLATFVGAVAVIFGHTNEIHQNHLLGLLISLAILEAGAGPLSLDQWMSRKGEG